MKMNNSRIVGIFLIIIGVLILLNKQGVEIFSWHSIRSYGFIFLGFFLLLRGLNRLPRRGIFSGSVLILIGVYFLLAELNFYYVTPGLSLCMITLAFGVSFYSLFFLTTREWGHLLYGNLIILIGLFFFLEYLQILPPYLLVNVVDLYWPVLIIVLGLILLASSLFKSRNA